MLALRADELIAWVDQTADGLHRLLEEHPGALTLACDIRESETVADLMQHIVAVELRYAERLHDLPETAYEAVPKHTAEAFRLTHARAMTLLRSLPMDDPAWWEQTIRFATRRGGRLRASRRTILVHLLMHSIRHSAQLATLLRQRGLPPDWPMDYLFMGAEPELSQ